MLELDPRRRRARRLGGIPEQTVRSPIFFVDSLSFVSTRFQFSLAVRRRDGSWARLPAVRSFARKHCGDDLIVERGLDDGRVVVDRIDQSGSWFDA